MLKQEEEGSSGGEAEEPCTSRDARLIVVDSCASEDAVAAAYLTISSNECNGPPGLLRLMCHGKQSEQTLTSSATLAFASCRRQMS